MRMDPNFKMLYKNYNDVPWGGIPYQLYFSKWISKPNFDIILLHEFNSRVGLYLS